jgi:hypothetical protein
MMRSAVWRTPSAVPNLLILLVFLGGIFAVSASAAAGKQLKPSEISLKDLQIKKRHLPKGWKLADKEQTAARQPAALYADPTIQGISPKVAQKGTVSYAVAGSGTTTAYQLLYRDAAAADRAMPLLMGFLWGPGMASSPTRPASVLRCGNVAVFVAGPDHERVAKWLLGKYAKRMPWTQPTGAPLELPAAPNTTAAPAAGTPAATPIPPGSAPGSEP